MLVIARREGEYVKIGEDIYIKIHRAQGEVKLAIEAPKDIPIVRDNIKKGMQ